MNLFKKDLVFFSAVGAVDQPTFNVISQAAHVWAGAMVTFAGFIFFPGAWGWIAFGWIVLMAAKEFIYDTEEESPNVRGSNFEDWIFSTVGVIVAASLLLIFKS